MNFKDAKGDWASSITGDVLIPPADRTGSTDIIGGFLTHDPSKGAEATSLNIVTQDLKAEVPSGGYTSMAHFGNYIFDGKQYFIRAIVDFTGSKVFEWGEFTPNPAGVVLTGVSLYKGATTGAYFEGPNGVVKIVIPPEAGGAAKSQLTQIYSQAGQSRNALPNAVPPNGSRGTTSILDTAPDGGEESTVKWTVAPCTAAAPVGGGAGPLTAPSSGGTGTPVTGGGSGGDAGSSGGTSEVPQSSGPATLPIKVSAAKAPKSKSLSVKLRSSEPVTDIGARLRKGSKAVGTGKIAKLDGAGKLKLKLSKKLKKGSYQLDLAGNLADGRRGVVTLKLRLK